MMPREATGLPPEAFLATLAGPTLADGCEATWQPPADARPSFCNVASAATKERLPLHLLEDLER
jgi:hypothetical protein